MPESHEFISAAEGKPPFFVGIDLGGTNIKVGVVDDLGRPLSWLSIPTDVEKGAEDASQRMGTAVRHVIQTASLEPQAVAGVGLGSPGEMDIPSGMLLKPINLKGWAYFPIRDRVSHHSGYQVTFANDADAAAYGEFWVGSGRDFHSLVLLTLGTGIGTGIIIGDMTLCGEHSHGGECGHIIINYDDDARWCGCGQRGHLEAYCSALSVVKRAQEALDVDIPSSLKQRIAEGEKLTPKLIATEAELGDKLSMDIILETAKYLGIGCVCLMNTLDTAGILLGGAMTFGGNESELGRRFLAAVKDEVNRRAFAFLAERTVIDFATLGGDAGYIGAAGLARVDYLKRGKG